ncbi:hypothetical protein B0J14DRAFT_610813 [Halenospora varia]|nr:hypothetical protein B0J14DRAFT_610813 [Halenospora varia]
MSKWGKTVISTRLLAASHVTSCPSFADRRAAYKCLPCHAKHFDIDFPSAAALEQHLKKHPNNKPLIEMEEKDVMKELNTNPKELGLEPEEESSPKDEALLQEEGSAGTSVQEYSRSFEPSIKTTIDNDSISISSIDEPEPRPASYSSKNTGPVLFDNPYQDEAPELEETPSRKEIAELDLYHATHGIPELDSTNHCPSPPPPNELPQTLSRSRPYPPQGPPLDTDYSNLNPQPSNDNPSRSHTPNSSLGAPVFAPQNNIGYQTHTGAQSYQGPPTPNRAPPSQPPYGPDSFLNRGSSDSARYQPDINQGPSPSMNDLSQGYSTQQFQEPIWAEPAEKKGARFWKKTNK